MWSSAMREAKDWDNRRYRPNDMPVDVYDRKTGKTVRMRADEANERKRIRMAEGARNRATNISAFTARLLASISRTEESKKITEEFRKSLTNGNSQR